MLKRKPHAPVYLVAATCGVTCACIEEPLMWPNTIHIKRVLGMRNSIIEVALVLNSVLIVHICFVAVCTCGI